MADSIVHNHTPKSETEEHGLFDRFRKKDEDNEDKSDGLLTKLHITDSSSGLSDEEEKKKDKTMKEKVEEKFEEDKVKMNVKIIEGRDTALNLKQKTVENIEGGKEKVGDIKEKIGEKIGGYNEKKEAKESEEQKAKYEEVVTQPLESSCEPEYKFPSGYKKAEDSVTTPPPPQLVAAANAETEHKEKKGIFEKIKEKLPGYHSKSEEDIEKEKECDKE